MGLQPRLIALNRTNTLVIGWPIRRAVVPYGFDRGIFAAIEQAGSSPAPSGLEMVAAVLAYLQDWPHDQLCIVGHASAEGASTHNQELSDTRAQSLELFVKGDRDAWADHAQQNQRTSDVQVAMLAIAQMYGWACQPGSIDDVFGSATKAGIDSFRANYNAYCGGSLVADAPFGTDDWKAVAQLYDEKLANLLNVSRDELAQQRAKIAWCSPPQRGLGEAFPIASITCIEPADMTACWPDRRAELLVLPEGLDLAAVAGADLTRLYSSRWLTFHGLAVVGEPFDLVVRLIPDEHAAAEISDSLVLCSDDGSSQRRALMADCTDCVEYVETTFAGLAPGKMYSLYIECPGVSDPHVIFSDIRGFALRNQTLVPLPPDSEAEPPPEDDPSTVGDFIEGPT